MRECERENKELLTKLRNYEELKQVRTSRFNPIIHRTQRCCVALAN